MRVVGGLLALVGTAVVGGGIALSVGAGPPTEAVMDPVVDRLGNDYLLVAAVGVVAFVLTLIAVMARAVSGVTQLQPPDPEGIPSAPRLGDEFNQYVHGRVGLRAHLLSDEEERVRNRLREAAVQTVMEDQGCSREAARRLIDEGEWTENVEAAAYLGKSPAPSPPWAARLKAALGGQRWRQRGAHETAQAILTKVDGRRS